MEERVHIGARDQERMHGESVGTSVLCLGCRLLSRSLVARRSGQGLGISRETLTFANHRTTSWKSSRKAASDARSSTLGPVMEASGMQGSSFTAPG